MDRTRQVGFALCRISYGEIEAYCRLMRVKLTSFDVSAITELDEIKMKATNGNG